MNKTAFAAVAAAALCIAAEGAPAFRASRNFPAIGLAFKTLGNGGEPEPLPQPKTYSYTRTSGGVSENVDFYDARELWYATQHAGQWHDKAGNQLVIGRATRMLPDVPTVAGAPHVRREDFDKAMADDASAFKPDDGAALSAWVAAFAGAKPGEPRKLRPSFRMTDSLFFPTDDADSVVYAFRVKVRGASGGFVPSDWFCAIVRIADGAKPEKVRKDFEAQFLPSLAGLSRAESMARDSSKELKITGPGNRAKAEIRSDPAREAAKKSVANMAGWWYAETPEYIFLSDVRSSLGKRLVRTLQNTMPAYRKTLEKTIPPFKPISDTSVVRIFENAEDYKRAVGKEHAWSIGLWSTAARELTILCQGKDEDATLETIRHEGFHQYLFYASSMIENSMWYNEGHACFFETAEIDSRGHVSIPENARVQQVAHELERVAQNIPAVLKAGNSEFYSQSGSQLQLNYTTAWALVYFLRKGVQTSKRYADYARILPAYRDKLVETKSCAAATRAAFSDIDPGKFQEDFAEFWKSDRKAALKKEPLPDKNEAPPDKQ